MVGSQALVDHVADAGLRIVNRTPFATRADVVVVGGHDGFDFDELQDRHPGRAARRRADRRDPRRTFPMPDGPWPGTGAVLAAVETATRPHGRRRGRQAGAGDVRRGARPPRAGPRCSRSATGSTSTSPARAAPAWTPRSCSPAARPRAQADAADPRPTHVADSLAARWCLASASLPGSHGPPRPPDRQPARRRRPRRAAAARRRGGAARARRRVPGRAHDVDRARARAGARRARRRRDRGRDGRRRADRRGGRRAARAPTRCSACSPAAAATTSRASSGSATTRSPRATCSRPARSGGSTSPRPAARVYLGILSAGFDSDVQRDRQRHAAAARHARLRLRRAARAVALAPGALGGDGRRRRAHAFAGYSVAVANSGVFGGGMWLVPDASLDDGLLDVVLTGASPKRDFLRGLPKVFKGTHVDEPGVHAPARARGHVPAPTGRSPPTPTATRSPSCRRPCACCPGALRVIVP